MSDGGGGKSAAELQEQERLSLLARPMRAACAFCQWSYEGPFGDARELSQAHRQEAHPEAVMSRRRSRSLGVKQARLSEQDIEEIESERRRRAAAHGIDLGD